MFRIALYPVGGSYLVVVAVALLLLGLLALGPGGDRLSRRQRAILTAMRLAVIVLLILAMLRPTLVYSRIKRQSATLLVLVDQSRSMSVPDAIGGKSRWEALRRSVADAQPALAKLAEDFELKAYVFDSEAHSIDVRNGKIPLGKTPEGPQTAIGAVLEDVLRSHAGKRLLGVILLSDGAQRAYAPRDLPPQIVAGRLKQLGYPLYTFPFGQSRGLGQAQDVAVKDLLVNQSVFVKNELAIAGQVRIDGYVNREIAVNLRFETSPGEMEVVAQQTLKATAGDQLLPVEFSYAPQVPGEYRLMLEVAGQPDELVTTNNRMSTFVNVLKGGLNVLYLEGAPPRVEQRFLRRALAASADINVDSPRPLLDPRRPETRPGDMPQWFQPGKYEVYILGDLDASIFRGDELKNLAEAVDRGSSLMMLGGLHSFGPGGYANTPLAGVLPVKMDRFERQKLDEPPRTDVHVAGLLPMRPTRFGLHHPALMLAGNQQESAALWAKLPSLRGANRLRPRTPLAVVLADAHSRVPLLIAQPFGRGRVMAFAGDSTWRWWMHGFETAHKRFWRQMILWLARKDQLGEGNVWIRLPKRRFAPAERVEFTTGAQSATGEPVADAEYQARMVLPDGKSRPLTLVRHGEQMAGSFRDTLAAGDYAIEVTAKQNGTTLGTARTRLLVFQQDLELDNAAADAASLESLAATTGGESLAPEQLAELIGRLAQRTERLEVLEEAKETFWDTWPFFLLLVGLLGVEWYLRKRWRLV